MRYLAYNLEEFSFQTFKTLAQAQQWVEQEFSDGWEDTILEGLENAFVLNTETNEVWRPSYVITGRSSDHECPHGCGICQGLDDCPQYPVGPDGCPEENPWEYGDWEFCGKIRWTHYKNKEQ